MRESKETKKPKQRRRLFAIEGKVYLSLGCLQDNKIETRQLSVRSAMETIISLRQRMGGWHSNQGIEHTMLSQKIEFHQYQKLGIIK